jgi:hypothetical protein
MNQDIFDMNKGFIDRDEWMTILEEGITVFTGSDGI